MSILEKEIIKSRDCDTSKTITIREFRSGIPIHMPLWIFYKQTIHLFKTAKKYKLDLVTYDISGLEYSLPLLFIFEEFLWQGGKVTYPPKKEVTLDAAKSIIHICKLEIFPKDILHLIRTYLYSSIVSDKSIYNTMNAYDLTYEIHHLASRT